MACHHPDSDADTYRRAQSLFQRRRPRPSPRLLQVHPLRAHRVSRAIVRGQIHRRPCQPHDARVLELAHNLASRHGLGSSLFAAPGPHITARTSRASQLRPYVRGRKRRRARAGHRPAALEKLLEQSLGKLSAPTSALAAAASKSAYFGGRPASTHMGARRRCSSGSAKQGRPLASSPCLRPTSTRPQLRSGRRARCPSQRRHPSRRLSAPCSSRTRTRRPLGCSSRATARRQAAGGAFKGASALKGKDLQRAVAKAKFVAARAYDVREGVVGTLGSKVRDSF